MIYLLALLVDWVGRALVPTAELLAAGVIVVIALRILLHRRPRVVARAWLLLGVAAVGFGGWRSFEVWRDFTQPQFRNFRTYVANPIPHDVRALAMDSPAPAMFYDGALVRFEAPEPVVRRLVDHSLAGARAWDLIGEMKRRSGRSPADTIAVAAPDGRGFVRIDPDAFTTPDAFAWTQHTVDEMHRGGAKEIYVLLLAGEWGSFQSVVAWTPERSRVSVHQALERRGALAMRP
jgi:hypothetical protein